MKFAIIILTIIFTHIAAYGQSEKQKEEFKTIEPDLWLGIWDKKNSIKSIKIDTLSYDDIPKNIDFRGTVVEALKWKDTIGENILIHSISGRFNWKDYDQDSTNFMIQDKSELYIYLFTKMKTENEFSKKWRIYDLNKCYGVDWFTGFVPKATTITDLDNNGITEISIPYVMICRGGMDPGEMKIIMYENHTKYAIRGETMIIDYGRKYTLSENLKQNEIFTKFLINQWNKHKLENGKYN